MTDKLPTREEYLNMTDAEQDRFDREHPDHANRLMMEGFEIRESAGNAFRRQQREKRDAGLSGEDDEG
jgi:hypothetical protein